MGPKEYTSSNAKVKLKNATPEATAALEQILRLAGAAPIPLCGQFFLVAAEAIKLVNVSMALVSY